MKYLLIIFIGLSFCVGCHKKKDDPAPTVDYADSLAGTYLGHETVNQGAPSGTVTYDNASKTITIVKVSENRIQIKGLSQGNPYYDCSQTVSGYVTLTGESPITDYGNWQNNSYHYSDKQLILNFKIPAGDYEYFIGTKQ